jgi:hypothetical protein
MIGEDLGAKWAITSGWCFSDQVWRNRVTVSRCMISPVLVYSANDNQNRRMREEGDKRTPDSADGASVTIYGAFAATAIINKPMICNNTTGRSGAMEVKRETICDEPLVRSVAMRLSLNGVQHATI